MSCLEGKVAIVTGASQGLGKGIALKLAGEGARVVVHYRHNQGQAEAVVRTIKAEGGEAIAIQADVTDIPQIEAMVAKTIQQYGKLHILISNAGIEFGRPMAEVSGKDFDRVFPPIHEDNFSQLSKRLSTWRMEGASF